MKVMCEVVSEYQRHACPDSENESRRTGMSEVTIRTCERASVYRNVGFLSRSSSSRKGEQLLACFGSNDLRALWLCRDPLVLVRTRGCLLVGRTTLQPRPCLRLKRHDATDRRNNDARR